MKARLRQGWTANRWRILGAALALTVALNVALAGWWIHGQVSEFDPLGPFPAQTIGLTETTSGGDGGTYPALIIRGDEWPDVPIVGEKCSTQTVQVEGSYVWQSVIPPGSYSAPSTGRALRLEGCTKLSYRNRVPDEVRARVRELAAQGVTSSVWSLQGKEVPFRPGTNDPGSPEFWSSRNFAIVWEG